MYPSHCGFILNYVNSKCPCKSYSSLYSRCKWPPWQTNPYPWVLFKILYLGHVPLMLYRIGEVEGEFKGNCERKHRQRLKTIVNRLVSREYYRWTGALRIWPGNNNEFCLMESWKQYFENKSIIKLLHSQHFKYLISLKYHWFNSMF